ncbi:hypothetical protein DRH13_02280 [Candidatus Woesebacteria bacterium]|nr:MAG: hypothetical protein DRH13_02280 [Candidatus Woesebacteria bacterium]
MKIDLFVIASGPSLTEEDCRLIANTGVPILAVNDSWQRTPRCNFLFAGDIKWWDAHAEEVPAKIQKFTSAKKAAMKHGINFFPANGAFNSGMRALMWALHTGFKNIVLLGFDCSIKKDIHWHGPHSKALGLSNPDKIMMRRWLIHFLDVYARAGRLEANIINCSRHTELKCFKCLTLEEVLGIKKVEKKEVTKEKHDKVVEVDLEHGAFRKAIIIKNKKKKENEKKEK